MNSRLVGWFLLGLGGWGCANSDVVGGDVALAHSPVPSLQDDASDGGFQDAGQSRETNSTGSRLKRTATDDHCDGTADHDCTVYEYDSAGDPSSYSVDSDCDGVAERLCKAPEFDVHGSLTNVDADCDGTPEVLCNEVIRDADGNVIRQALDADCERAHSTRAASSRASAPTMVATGRTKTAAQSRSTRRATSR